MKRSKKIAISLLIALLIVINCSNVYGNHRFSKELYIYNIIIAFICFILAIYAVTVVVFAIVATIVYLVKRKKLDKKNYKQLKIGLILVLIICAIMLCIALWFKSNA